MLSTLRTFSDWLAQTGLSEVIQNVSWIIPTVQTIHIVSVAIVISATFLVSLRVLGVFDRAEALAALSNRFLPWVWYALVVLLVTGSLLIIGEPGRSLLNPAFAAKMLMLLVVAALTWYCSDRWSPKRGTGTRPLSARRWPGASRCCHSRSGRASCSRGAGSPT